MEQYLLVSGILGGLSLPGCAGMLCRPGVRSCSPHGEKAFLAQQELHMCLGLGAGRGDIPSGSDRWGEPATPQAWSRASGIRHLHHGCVCSE